MYQIAYIGTIIHRMEELEKVESGTERLSLKNVDLYIVNIWTLKNVTGKIWTAV